MCHDGQRSVPSIKCPSDQFPPPGAALDTLKRNICGDEILANISNISTEIAQTYIDILHCKKKNNPDILASVGK